VVGNSIFEGTALLDVETGEPGMPLYVPPNAGIKPAPKRTPAHHKPRPKPNHRHKRRQRR
jgi:hypothetical protein